MNNEFAVHKLNDEGMKKAKLIAENFDSLLKTISIVCIDGREMSICRTKLEEACFFAKKAMAIDLGNQQHDFVGSCEKGLVPEPPHFRKMNMNAPDEKY